MSNYTMTPPDMPAGTSEQQLRALYTYLWRMNEALTVALNQIDTQVRTVQIKTNTGDQQTGVSEQTRNAITREAENLRALIIKSADEIEQEMDVVLESLASTYLARSEFGTFRQGLNQTIKQTAESVVHDFGLEESINALEAASASFGEYKVLSNQYIKMGLLYYEDTIPRYGVAVGENMTTVIVDGKEVINRQNLCATFTSDRLSFWMSNAEIAYVSNRVLHIAAAQVEEMTIHEQWKMYEDADQGLCIEWIGGVPVGGVL